MGQVGSVSLLGDGALWIWRRVQVTLAQGRETLNVYGERKRILLDRLDFASKDEAAASTKGILR
jgi:hypothetical protein